MNKVTIMNALNIEDILKKCKELWNQNREPEAVILLDEAINRENDSRLFYTRGITFDFLKEPDRAVQDLTSAILIDGNKPDYFYQRGCILSHHLKKDDAAIKDFEKALELDPNCKEAHIESCLSFLLLGLPDRALEHAETSLKLAPDDARAFFCLGQCYMSLQRFQDAVSPLSQALTMDPEKDQYFSALSRAIEHINNIDREQASWTKT